jgi:hypothetical protein
MSDYIDRDLLLAEIEELKKSPWYNDCGENYERIIRSDAIGTVVDLCVKSAPVADVQEVKHGEWIKDNDSFQPDDYYCVYFDYTCSECDKIVNDRYKLPSYCPRCGAKMDGGSNNNG